MDTFAQRLGAAVDAVASPIVIGLDPTPEALPQSLVRGGQGNRPLELEELLAFYREFLTGTLEVCRPYSAVTKIQSAFFERHGWRGVQLFHEMIAVARSHGYLVIADVKRNDIGHTAQAYAAAFLGELDDDAGVREANPPLADAMTVTPIFGDEGNQPFLDACARRSCGLFFIVRTSNPSSAQLQALELADGRRFDQAVADLVAAYAERYGAPGETWSSIGAVVGATRHEVLCELRARLPRSPLLLPGVGAQGASIEPLLQVFDARGHGALIPISRGILRAHQAAGAPSQWRSAVASAARSYARRFQELLPR